MINGRKAYCLSTFFFSSEAYSSDARYFSKATKQTTSMTKNLFKNPFQIIIHKSGLISNSHSVLRTMLKSISYFTSFQWSRRDHTKFTTLRMLVQKYKENTLLWIYNFQTLVSTPGRSLSIVNETVQSMGIIT